MVVRIDEDREAWDGVKDRYGCKTTPHKVGIEMYKHNICIIFSAVSLLPSYWVGARSAAPPPLSPFLLLSNHHLPPSVCASKSHCPAFNLTISVAR